MENFPCSVFSVRYSKINAAHHSEIAHAHLGTNIRKKIIIQLCCLLVIKEKVIKGEKWPWKYSRMPSLRASLVCTSLHILSPPQNSRKSVLNYLIAWILTDSFCTLLLCVRDCCVRLLFSHYFSYLKINQEYLQFALIFKY